MRSLILALTFLLNMLVYPATAKSLHINVFDGHNDYLLYSRSYSTAWLVLQRAAAKQNIQIEAYEEAWIRSITFLRENKGVTAVFGAMPSEQRKVWTSFSPPLSIEHIAAYVETNAKIETFEQLMTNKERYSVGVTRGSIHLDIAKQLAFPYVITFTKREKLFDMLKHGKLDAIIYTHALTHYYCGKVFKISGGACVRQLGEPIENSTLHFVYEQNNTQTNRVVEEIVFAVEQMYQQGEIAQIFSKKDYSEKDYQFWQRQYLSWQQEQLKAN